MPTEEDKVTRKLRAILSADVKGYSLLMSDDEAFTVKTLISYRALMSGQIEKHTGRVVDAPGDNLLAEFASVVDAVQCAVEIQRVLKAKNENLPEDKRLEFRIGVNIGDVIQEGDNLYGEGVNIAARIEGLADSGGVCISRNAYDHVKNKLTLGYEYIGEHTVKNIKDPVRVYKVLMADEDAGKLIGDVPKPVTKKWIWATAVLAVIVITAVVSQVYQKMTEPEFEPARIEKMAYPLPEKPSIAVLAFDNMTGDKEQEYFSDGLSEEIITALASVPNLFVIARNSSFAYKGKPVNVKQVSEELGIRYVLEGSVRKSKDKVRITAQLIDAFTGHHLWAESYDRTLDDIFNIQEEITMKVITELRVELTQGEIARMALPCLSNLKAYLKYLKAMKYFYNWNMEDLKTSQRLAEEAVTLDPEYACAYNLLGGIYIMKFRWGAAKSGKQSLEMATKMINKAKTLNPLLSGPNSLLSVKYRIMGQYEKAIEEAEEAISLAPNSTMANTAMGNALMANGSYEEGLKFLQQSTRIDPYDPTGFIALGFSYVLARQYEDGIRTCKKAADISPNNIYSPLCLASAYSAIERDVEARAAAKEVFRINSQFSIDKFRKDLKYKKQEDVELLLHNLRKAGLPETIHRKEPPKKPSIAVLPFDNLSDDPEQGYLADGLTDELIGDLAKIEGIFVISRNSTFTYKGKDIKIPEVAKELNVRYVLEGSVQRAGNRLRIRAQLIDGKTDHHVWSESYDGDGTMDNIFELQDEITGKIVTALAVKLTENEKERISDRGTENIEAYEAFLKGKEVFAEYSPEGCLLAIKHFEDAIQVDPTFIRTYALLGSVYQLAANYGFYRKMNIDRSVARLKAVNYLQLAMQKPTFEGYVLSSIIALNLRHFGEAIAFAEKVISISPGASEGYNFLGTALMWSGKPEQGTQLLKRAIHLDPRSGRVARIEAVIGNAYFSLGQLEKAIDHLTKSFELNSNLRSVFSPSLAASYALLGNMDDAKIALEDYLNFFKGYHPPLQFFYYVWPFKNAHVFDRLAEGLVKAGLNGDAGDYFKVDQQNKLTGKEIKNLFYGHAVAQRDVFFQAERRWDFDKDGKFLYRGDNIEAKGRSWIDEDMICRQAEMLFDGLTNCSEVYKNPDGRSEDNNEYLILDYVFMHTLSVKDSGKKGQ